MNLIGTEQKQLLVLLVKNYILHYHLMRFGNFKHLGSKFQIVCNRSICSILPAGKKLFVELFLARRRKILRIDCIGNHKHLHSRKHTCKLALTDILLYLSETVHVGMLTVFQLDMYKRDSVYQQRHVKAAILVVNIALVVL